jgi:hypothetical protein
MRADDRCVRVPLERKITSAISGATRWFHLVSPKKITDAASTRAELTETEKSAAAFEYLGRLVLWVRNAREYGFATEDDVAEYLFNHPKFRKSYPTRHDYLYRAVIRKVLEFF